MEVRDNRMALVCGIVDGLTDADLERVCSRLPAPGYPEEMRPVGRFLGVVMKEECEPAATRYATSLWPQDARPKSSGSKQSIN